MARVATTNLNLGTWLDNENPGAGSQTVDNTGLNGNALKLDVAVGTEHNTNGTHKSNIIDKGNLKTTVADGSTLEKDGTVGLRIKDLGVTSAKIAANAVTAGKLADGAVETAARIVDAIITGAKLADNTIPTAKYQNDSVTSAKMPHDNNVRRLIIPGTIATGMTWMSFGNADPASGQGVPMLRSGIITGYALVGADGSVGYGTKVYASTGTAADGRFGLGDKLSISRNTSSGVITVKIGGTTVTGFTTGGTLSNPATDDLVGQIEVELDD